MALGRSFSPAEDTPTAPRSRASAMLSGGAGSPATRKSSAKSFRWAAFSYQIIGVTAPGYRTEEDPPVEVYIPFQIDPNTVDQANYFGVAGRLKPGVTLAVPAAKMKLVGEEFRRKFPAALGPNNGFGVQTMKEVLIGDVKSSLLVLLGAVGFCCSSPAPTWPICCSRAPPAARAKSPFARPSARAAAASFASCSPKAWCCRSPAASSVWPWVAANRACFSPSIRRNIPRIGNGPHHVTLDWRVLAFTLRAFFRHRRFLRPGSGAASLARRPSSSTLQESSGRSGTRLRQNKARCAAGGHRDGAGRWFYWSARRC